MAESTIRHSCFFDVLSDELIIQVLHHCQYNEILQFATTNKRHYIIVSESVSLKLHIELEVNGLYIVQGSRSRDGTYSRLLDELVRYRNSWLNLDLEEPIERNSNQVMSLWELREGNYVVAFSSTSSQAWGPDSIQITPIDPLETPQPVTFSTVFSEFTPDFEQELVALIKTDPNDTTRLEVRLCSAITGHSHPLARNPTFTVQVDFQIPGPGRQTFTLEIVENILVVRIADIMRDRYEILAWDWKSGALLCRVGCDSGLADFALLDSTHLALFSVEVEGAGPRLITISLYSIHQMYGELSSGQVFYATEYTCARPILTFEFPKLDNSHVVASRVIMRSDPIPQRTVYTKSASFAHCTALTFSIILSLLDLSNPGADEHSVNLRIFISVQSLRSHLLELANEEDTTVVPWDVWGTRATRWFLCDKPTSYWVYWTSGSRFVRVDENPDSARHDLSVFEFHTPMVRRHALSYIHSSLEQQASQYKEKTKEIVLKGSGLSCPHPANSLLDTDLPPLLVNTVGSDMPTIIETGFSIPVESCLPYRVVTRPNFVPWCEDWSIDGDHIIGTTPVRRNVDRLTVYKLRT
ncbi:hypothetical protein B0J17DRAFT_640125 [Rhizoctonia solani]|nr:hypothetical protein B0J17DRAFT_640125 [Rhizoctonia solani]